MLIDSHSHPYFKDYDKDRSAMLQRAFDGNIHMLAIGTDPQTNAQAIKLASEHPDYIHATVGFHPGDIRPDTTAAVTEFEDLINAHKDIVVGIGEIGLDYYRLRSGRAQTTVEAQKQIFVQFVELAKRLELPMVIHARGSKDDPFGVVDDILSILEEKKYFNGVFHCYAGNSAQAKQITEKGMYMGITGIITFKNAQELKDVVMHTDLQSLLIETDCPFLTPEPHRGERNEPSYVAFVAKKIAELKGLSVEAVARQTTLNAQKLFSL